MSFYELRYSDTADVTLGDAPVASYHDTIEDAASAFVHHPATFTQLIHVADCGDARFLTDTEEQVVERVCDGHGVETEEVEA